MILEEIWKIQSEYNTWVDWHCKNKACDHHLCRKRSAKMCELRVKLAIIADMCRDAGVTMGRRYSIKPTSG
jgi:hypothetical protein